MSDDEIQAYVLERLSDGDLLAEVAAEVGIKRTTLYMRFQSSPALVDAYARAREEGLQARGERLRKMTQRELPKLPNGAVDAAAVSQLKLEVDTEKWTLSKLLPKVYGDRQSVELANPPGETFKSDVTLSPEEAYKRMIGV